MAIIEQVGHLAPDEYQKKWPAFGCWKNQSLKQEAEINSQGSANPYSCVANNLTIISCDVS